MKINSRLHGLLDFTFGFILLLPYIATYQESAADSEFLMALGIAILTMSLLTDYEFGLVKLIPFKVHLVIDIVVNLLLLLSPLMLDLRNYMLYWPAVLGGAGMLIVIFSSRVAYRHKPGDSNITIP